MTTQTKETRRATADGRCDCCMMPYCAGARLRLEHGRYWVLDPHPMPDPAASKKGGRS